MMSIAQLKSLFDDENLYQRFRLNYFDVVEMKEMLNIEYEKFYEIEKLIDRRIKIFDRIFVI